MVNQISFLSQRTTRHISFPVLNGSLDSFRFHWINDKMPSALSFLDLPLPVFDLHRLRTGHPHPIQIFKQKKMVYSHQDQFLMGPGFCAHRGTPLINSQICSQGNLICPYHGKTNKPLAQLFSSHGALWTQDPTSLFKENHRDMLFCGSKSYDLSAPFLVVLDNFNEGSHTPWIHGLLGPKPKEAGLIEFDWQAKEKAVEIHYRGPQRKNLFFAGWLPRKKLIWDIRWQTFVDPVYMKYHSVWFDAENQNKIFAENINYYFLLPLDENKTRLHSFVFTRPHGWLTLFPFFVKKISMMLTKNQIVEDEVFYQKSSGLAQEIEHYDLDQYDMPLLEIRRRLQLSRLNYF
jgi:phenylpropionate dioxygenase-like ring-hydroxylating dioxygenase large terminal subunit